MNKGCQIISICLVVIGLMLAIPFTIFYSDNVSHVRSADKDFNCDNCVVNYDHKDCMHGNCTFIIDSCWCCKHPSIYERYNTCEVWVHGNTDTCSSDYTKLLCYKQKIDYEREIRTEEITNAIVSAVSWCIAITYAINSIYLCCTDF